MKDSKFDKLFDKHPFIAVSIVGLAFIIGGLGILGPISYAMSRRSCSDITAQTGIETKYTFWSGCYVRLDSQWVPEERWRHLQ